MADLLVVVAVVAFVAAMLGLTWAAGQAIAASGSGALAEATSDVVPYLLLGVACLATLGGMLRPRSQVPGGKA